MELDKRFKVLPFCCFGTEKRVVTNHIGEKGYFANEISSFCDINICKYGTLGSILGDQQESFYMSETDGFPTDPNTGKQNGDNDAIVCIGGYSFKLTELFTDYEQYDNMKDIWVPCGVEVEE